MPTNTCFDEAGGGSGGGGGGSGASGTSSASEGESTTPTTSGGGETTDSATDTGGDGDDIYFCSPQSPWKCANLNPDNALVDSPAYPDPYTDGNDPLHPTWDACWASVNPASPPQISKCTTGVSVQDARNKCQNDCIEYRKAMLKECADDVDCDLTTTIDCDLDGTYVNSSGQQINGDPGGEQPVLKSQLPGWECDGEPIMMSVGPFNQFLASATLVTPQGVSAGVSNFGGYLGYKLSDCTPSTCTITIDTLVSLTKVVEGGYSDAAGMGGVFEVERMGLQLTAPFSGTWNRSRKTLTFASAVMSTQFWASEVLIDGGSVTPDYGAYTAETDQIVGTLDTVDGPLSLNFIHDMPFYGIVSMSLRTLPPG